MDRLKEVIIVEGRDDTAAIKRAYDTDTIETHGFGIRRSTWELIEKAYNERGIIVFTDPDYSGEEIRRKLSKRFPGAKHAYLARKDAEKQGDIGIENASPEAIREALSKVHYTLCDRGMIFSMRDLSDNGLSGGSGSSKRREEVGKILGIGYGSSKRFLEKLNSYGITREAFDRAVESIEKRIE